VKGLELERMNLKPVRVDDGKVAYQQVATLLDNVDDSLSSLS